MVKEGWGVKNPNIRLHHMWTYPMGNKHFYQNQLSMTVKYYLWNAAATWHDEIVCPI